MEEEDFSDLMDDCSYLDLPSPLWMSDDTPELAEARMDTTAPSRSASVGKKLYRAEEDNDDAENDEPAKKKAALSSSDTTEEPPVDRLSGLPEDVLCRITGCLDAPDLLRLRQVNRSWQRLCGSNVAGWTQLCCSLWKHKVHVGAAALEEFLDNNNHMRAYQLAQQDAQVRHAVSRDEFCFDIDKAVREASSSSDPQSSLLPSHLSRQTVWSFRFKQSAGNDWTTADPWYQGRAARQVVFLTNGRVLEYIDKREENEDSSAQPPSPEEAVQAAAVNANANQAAANAPPNPPLAAAPASTTVVVETDSFVLREPPMPMSWRFLTRPMDLPTRPEAGSYVRFTVAGRDVPTYSVRRSPTGNWGFCMESCWGLYTSFSLPRKRPEAATSHLPSPSAVQAALRRVRQRRRLRRAEDDTARWVLELEEDEDAEDSVNSTTATSESENGGAQPSDPALDAEAAAGALLEDEALLITNDVQWREAFLYNVGARILPEGEDATVEFDRAWGGGNQQPAAGYL